MKLKAIGHPAQKRNGKIEPCSVCGTNVRPGIRAVPHPETAECKASVVRRAYLERGWVNIASQWIPVLKNAAVPVEQALGGVHTQEYAETDKEGRITRRWSQDEQHLVYFVPQTAARICMLLTRLKISPDLRRDVVKAGWQNEDVYASIDSVARMGKVTTKFLRSVVREAQLGELASKPTQLRCGSYEVELEEVADEQDAERYDT